MGRLIFFPKSNEISTTQGRRHAFAYMLWADHGILRALWHNMHEISPGVFRSNYPDTSRISALADRGITTIISLRGKGSNPWSLIEEEACASHGIELHCVSLKATAAPSQTAMMELISLFRRVKKPLLFHCKSGADRAGLASAIYLMVIEGKSVANARRMLATRYFHFPFLRTGVLGYLLDEFAASEQSNFEDWVLRGYDAEALQKRFNASRRKPFGRKT